MKHNTTKSTPPSTLPVLYTAFADEDNTTQELLREYLADGLTETDLYTVRIPAGGGRAWELPGEEVATVFLGILVATTNSRAYWAQAYSGSGTPANCSSRDGKTGVGDPGGECEICPLAQWGSAPSGRGKACQERKTVYILRPEDVLPVRLQLPATSFVNLRKFQMDLLNRRLRQSAAIAEIGLMKVQNKTGIEYSQATFRFSGALTGDIAARAQAYTTLIQRSLGSKIASALEEEAVLIGDSGPGGIPTVDEDDLPFDWEKGPQGKPIGKKDS